MKNMQWTNLVMFFFALALVSIFSIATFFDKGDKTYELVDGSNNVLELSDTAKTKVEPNEATVNLRIVTRDSSHEEAVNENTKINNEIIEHFQDDYEVISQSYQVREWTENDPVRPYEEGSPDEEIKGYEVYNTIQITTEEVDEAGNIITEAFELGAKEIRSVDYGLTEEKERELQDKLTEEAIDLIQQRAESIAETAGVELESITKISPDRWGYTPTTVRDHEIMMEAEDSASGYQEPDFSPEEEEVSASVSMTYKIG